MSLVVLLLYIYVSKVDKNLDLNNFQNVPYFTGIPIIDNRWWSSLSYIIIIIFCFCTAEKFFPIHIFFYNCSIIRSIVLCWVSQQIYSKPILEFIEFVACSIFCSSFFRSLNSLFCCINLVKKLQKLTKDFNDRLRSRMSFFNFELKHPSELGCISRVCLDTLK